MDFLYAFAFSSHVRLILLGTPLIALTLLLGNLVCWRVYHQKVLKAYVALLQGASPRYTAKMAQECAVRFTDTSEYSDGLPYWIRVAPLKQMLDLYARLSVGRVLLCAAYHCVPLVSQVFVLWYVATALISLTKSANNRLAWLP